MTRAILPARAEWLLAGLTDRALSHRVRAPSLDGGGEDDDADTGADTTTVHISAVLELPVVPARLPGAACSLMYQYGLELEAPFEDPRRIFWSQTLRPRAGGLAQPLPSVSQLANRQKGAHFLSDLLLAHAFPHHTIILHLTHIWSCGESDVIEHDDILALATAVYSSNYVSPQHRYPRTLPELLTAVAGLLTGQKPDDAPVLCHARTIQQVTDIEFRML